MHLRQIGRRLGGAMRSVLGKWLTALALYALVLSPVAAASAAGTSQFTAPVQLGFKAGDDWEPAVAADRFGHVYAMWTHYGADPDCPACASPHSELQVSSD